MQKLERDGKVAVVYSADYGAGWSTWNPQYREELCMDADIATAVLEGDLEEAAKIATRKYPDIYDGGSETLTIEWVDKGEAFEIVEYDGSESVVIISNKTYMVA